jgi:hypothetical protein
MVALAGTSIEPGATTGGGISRGVAQGQEGADLGAAESRARWARAFHGDSALQKQATGEKPDARSMSSSHGSRSIAGLA